MIKRKNGTTPVVPLFVSRILKWYKVDLELDQSQYRWYFENDPSVLTSIMNIHPGKTGLSVTLSHAKELPAVSFVKAGMVRKKIYW